MTVYTEDSATGLQMLEALCEGYWNAFRDGYIAVGGDPASYPVWKNSRDPVKQETRRCMRHAVEQLKELMFDPTEIKALFPAVPQKRKLKQTPNDEAFARQYAMGKIEDQPL